MPLPITERQQQFSFAYARAVSAVAGFDCSKAGDGDFDGVDLAIKENGGSGTILSPQVEVQVKSITGPSPTSNEFPYDLEVRNYNLLVPTNFSVPRILLVVVVPQGVENWLLQDHQSLVVHRSGYWISLRGRDRSENSATQRIQIPTSNLFTPDALRGILQRIGMEDLP